MHVTFTTTAWRDDEIWKKNLIRRDLTERLSCGIHLELQMTCSAVWWETTSAGQKGRPASHFSLPLWYVNVLLTNVIKLEIVKQNRNNKYIDFRLNDGPRAVYTGTGARRVTTKWTHLMHTNAHNWTTWFTVRVNTTVKCRVTLAQL